MTSTIDQNIRHLRKQRGLMQEQLAEALGVSTGAVSKWERGAATPELKYIMEMANIFGVSTDTLIGYQICDSSCEALSARILSLQQKKCYEEGINEATQALRRYPNRFSVVYRCGELYMVNGVENHDIKSIKRAIELLNQAVLLLEQNTDPHITEFTIQTALAQCHLVLQQPNKALEILKKYNDGGAHDALIGLTYAVSDRYQPEEAVPFLSKAFAFGITSLLRTMIGYANYYSKKEDFGAALDALLWLIRYLESVKTDPEAITYVDKIFGVIYVGCAIYSDLLGSPKEALQYLRKAYTCARDNDASPVSSAKGIRFLMTDMEDCTLYDDIGASALEAAEAQLAQDFCSERLRLKWQEMINEENL